MIPKPRADCSASLALLLGWFDHHKRDLPWRRTRDQYAIWVSEIMLQQTQVATVIPYWERWMARFPTVDSLALADEQEVLSLWQGLGYYRRCRMLHAGARWVAEHGLPSNARAWRDVPGVGRYTAGAIASIALGEAAALVDGNVERVFARLAANDSAGLALNREAWRWASGALDLERPGDWNQALMELGATICRPRAPLCSECPVSSQCLAFQRGDPERFPSKVPARETVDLSFHVLVPRSAQGRYGFRQIASGQWWEGMWEFPRALSLAELSSFEGDRTPLSIVRHIVTHHRVALHVSLLSVTREFEDLRWLEPAELEALPMPAPQRKIYRLAREPRLL